MPPVTPQRDNFTSSVAQVGQAGRGSFGSFHTFTDASENHCQVHLHPAGTWKYCCVSVPNLELIPYECLIPVPLRQTVHFIHFTLSTLFSSISVHVTASHPLCCLFLLLCPTHSFALHLPPPLALPLLSCHMFAQISSDFFLLQPLV